MGLLVGWWCLWLVRLRLRCVLLRSCGCGCLLLSMGWLRLGQ